MSAVALIPLGLWFTFSVINHIGDDHSAVANWVGTPSVAVLLTLFLAFMFYHAHLGLQVVIEDYVHSEGLKFGLLVLQRGILLLATIGAVFSVLRIAL